MLASLGALALSAFLSATFLPGTTEALLATLLVTTEIASWLLVAVASAFNVLGSAVNYAIGLALARFRDTRWMPVSDEQLSRARSWFERWGASVLLFAWLPVIGDAIPVLAGVLRLNPWVAFPVIAIGKTARFAAVAWLVMAAGGG